MNQPLTSQAQILRMAATAAKIGFWSWSPPDRFRWDDSFYELVGLDPAEHQPSPSTLLKFVHPDDRHFLEEGGRAIMAGQVPKPLDQFRFTGPDGKLRWFEIHRARVPGSNDIVGLVQDFTERKRSEEHIRLLMREVNHRSKNMLAVVQSVANQTAIRSEPGDFLQRFGERLQGLAASHDLLVRNAWKGVELSELIRSQLSHLGDLLGRRIIVQGPAVHLSAAAAQSLGMAFHELATNAGKYGSLSNGSGKLLITWETAEVDGATVLRLKWVESGGPPVASPKRKGFGSILITDVARQSLEAEVTLDFPENGLVWKFEGPLANFIQS